MFSITERQRAIDKLETLETDVLIIGGGITGAGLAVQSQASGLQTTLLEMQDFGEGTSSRSTKLVHGGIRYLKNFDVEVVSDTVSERAVVQGIAPHIPKPDPMLLPIYDNEGETTFDMFSVKVAMDLYDQLANVTDERYTNYTLTAEEALEREPLLRREGLQGAGVYLDFNNNDARLVIDNIKKAHEDGGVMLSRMRVVNFLYDANRQITGVRAKDMLSGEMHDIHARLVVNTSGPWVDKVRELNMERPVRPMMRPTKGVHLVVDSDKLPVPQPTYFDTGKNDGRMVFVIPRENKTYFGTTDTDYSGNLAHPTVTQDDVDYLLEVINYRFPDADIKLSDIESSWAGLRPLLGNNSGSDYNGGDNGSLSDNSFDAVIDIVSKYNAGDVTRFAVEKVLGNLETNRGEKSPSSVSRGSSLDRESDGLITLSGGKITDYRKMAVGAMKLIQKILKQEDGREIDLVDSKHYQISGGEFDPTKLEETVEMLTKEGVKQGVPEDDARYLASFYGLNARKIYDRYDENDTFDGLDAVESARLRYAFDEEMALMPSDYFLRRTNHLLFARETLDTLREPVLLAFAHVYGWDAAELAKQTDAFDQIVRESDLSDLKGAYTND